LSDLFLVIKDGLAVTNSLSYRDKSNWIITGVNQGGKTTFLRSIGIAQFLAQSGYFVAAEQYKCNLYQGIFTHFPEEEDTAIKLGLLEQELLKLSDIITCITPGSLLLLNETFATTTDYDAAYLAEELLAGIRDSNITCLYVTHNYEFSYRLYRENRTEDVFLRADRADDGTRSFRLIEGEPRKTGHALDLYREVMGSEVC
jgi:DNA mismatch repair ATPase MutS